MVGEEEGGRNEIWGRQAGAPEEVHLVAGVVVQYLNEDVSIRHGSDVRQEDAVASHHPQTKAPRAPTDVRAGSTVQDQCESRGEEEGCGVLVPAAPWEAPLRASRQCTHGTRKA